LLYLVGTPELNQCSNLIQLYIEIYNAIKKKYLLPNMIFFEGLNDELLNVI